MEGSGDPASRARALFKKFLAERWFGGPDFDSWVRQHVDLEKELVRLRDEWFAQLADEESPMALQAAPAGWRSAASFEPGEILGGFRLLEKLGRGAMGEVWAAEELALGNRRVALKLLRPDLVSDRRALERFRREALAGARIRHPGIVAVYSAGRAQGQPYIAQELVEGGLTLAGLIAGERAKGKPGSEHFRRAAGLVAQAADALHAAHEGGTVHRDVKPQNILVAPGDLVKVADFGLAHLAGEAALSQTGDVVGTFCYMSPAQIRGEARKLDARADVFSLGATLYELLTLHRAFAGDSPHEIARKVQYEDPPSARALGLHLPRDLELICAKALEKHPAERYAGMDQLAADLRRYLRGEPILAKATSFRGRVRKWTRRHPTLSVGFGVALAASLGLVWLSRVNAQERRGLLREKLLADAQLVCEMGDLERAGRLVDQAGALDESDPTGHLILASAYARLGRVPESDREIGLARERGFGDDTAKIDTALEHGAYGLYLQSRRDFALYPEAERHIRRALELEPARYGLELALFQMHIAVGDSAGASAALESFQAHIPSGDPLYQIVESLRLETSGEPGAALDVLDRLGAQMEGNEERLTELRWHRNAGRLCVRLGELERAEGLLRRAVKDAPSDCWSWGWLAMLYMQRMQGGDDRAATREDAHECSQRAQACSSSLPVPLLVDAYLAEWELGQPPGTADVRQTESWRVAREALDRYGTLAGGGAREALPLESHLLWLEALASYRSHDYGRAAELFEGALELDPDSLLAAALLGQCHWWLDRPAEGLAVLQTALQRYDDPSWSGKREPKYIKYFGAILAWSLGNAARASDPAAFGRARERFVLELERGTPFEKEELFSAAEFLAKAPGELRDCELAWTLIEEHGLRTAFEGTADAAEVRRILAEISAACP